MITLSTSATSFVLAGHLPARTGNAISSCTQTLLEPRLATAPGQDARHERATPLLQTGSREKSIRPGTSPEPAPTRAVMEDINSRGYVTVALGRYGLMVAEGSLAAREQLTGPGPGALPEGVADGQRDRVRCE
jgi:hypothetical protein